MYRERCRPEYTDAELREVYSAPWEMQDDWEDHRRRMIKTKEVADIMINDQMRTAADLSCGDARWSEEYRQLEWTLGDYAPKYEYTGPIESTISAIDPVDIFFCCETLEHLNDPESVLRQIRDKASRLVVSTPLKNEWDENPEHYWAWDEKAVEYMLKATGWTPVEFRVANQFDHTHVNGYCFQIWGCL